MSSFLWVAVKRDEAERIMRFSSDSVFSLRTSSEWMRVSTASLESELIPTTLSHWEREGYF